ncbi:MAG: FAD-dependent oxidoreductase [Hyphomicrobium sp.]|uniref:NAD(P)/FAD-dependent oxidoreductase n=1 Tax=Hyphomicrobium sp. TaxID=82 RepID=UPI0039E688CF
MKIQHYDVLIVGAGQAGAQTAISLRQHGYAGTIGLIGKELELPYERPALSKDYLSGDRPFEGLLIRPSEFWKKQDIALHLGVEAVLVDTEEKVVNGKDGALFGYQNLVWAAGGDPRRLSCAGNNLANLHTIRSRADVDKLRDELDVARRVIVVGGGYLGLEAAATLKGLGKDVVLIEAADHILARVAGEDVSRFFEAEHRARGVDLRLSSSVFRITGDGGRATGVELSGGELVAGDLILVAVGIDAVVAPLMRAGAKGRSGVLVNSSCETSLPGIYAVGDCTECANVHSGGAVMRIESVQNANDQANVAARAIVGMAASYEAVPWFWSNQFDLRLQTVGLSKPHDAVVIRGDRAKRSFSVIYLRGGRVVAMDCINATKDFVQGRGIVGRNLTLPLDKLADVSIPLKEIAQMASPMENVL